MKYLGSKIIVTWYVLTAGAHKGLILCLGCKGFRGAPAEKLDITLDEQLARHIRCSTCGTRNPDHQR